MHLLLLATLLTLVALPAPAGAGGVARPSASEARVMARVRAGSYRPLYGQSGSPRTRVGAFLIDRSPVTRAAFQRFVATHAAWRRGTVSGAVADARYLAEWPSAEQAGDATDLRRPVTSVSWFAARAYCAAKGKRLPTLDEWEYVAAADETRRDASADPAFRRRVLAMNLARTATPPAAGRSAANAFGVRDLHGVVWEWTEDFSAAASADHAHPAGGGGDAHARHAYCASAAIGARDPTDYAAFARSAVRASLTAGSTASGVGFRCAADLPA